MPSSEVITTLKYPQDWETWINEVRDYAHPEIWVYIDPDKDELPDGVPSLLERPVRPKVQDFERSATTYASLTLPNRREFDNARKHYEVDNEAFEKQQERIRDI